MDPTTPDATAALQTLDLADLPPGVNARVVAVTTADPRAPAELPRRLAEIGFLPGEIVRVVTRGWLAREPVAVRVGTGTFALRRFEAACVHVRPEPALSG